jgi:hypothetical protein
MTYSIVFWANYTESKSLSSTKENQSNDWVWISDTLQTIISIIENNNITFTINTILNEIFVT